MCKIALVAIAIALLFVFLLVWADILWPEDGDWYDEDD